MSAKYNWQISESDPQKDIELAMRIVLEVEKRYWKEEIGVFEYLNNHKNHHEIRLAETKTRVASK